MPRYGSTPHHHSVHGLVGRVLYECRVTRVYLFVIEHPILHKARHGQWQCVGYFELPPTWPRHTPLSPGKRGAATARGALGWYRPSVGVPRDVGCRAVVVYVANSFSVQCRSRCEVVEQRCRAVTVTCIPRSVVLLQRECALSKTRRSAPAALSTPEISAAPSRILHIVNQLNDLTLANHLLVTPTRFLFTSLFEQKYCNSVF